MIIRKATPEDISTIDDLYKNIDPNHKSSVYFLQEFLQLPHCFMAVVVEDETEKDPGSIVGTCCFVELLQPSLQKDAYMHDFRVRRDKQRQGYGRAVFTAIEEEARRRGCVRIIFTSKPRRGMEEVYVRWGYEKIAAAHGDNGTNLFEKRLL